MTALAILAGVKSAPDSIILLASSGSGEAIINASTMPK
jgi:hypothetical protein